MYIFNYLVRSLGEGNSYPTLAFLPGKSHGQRSLGGCSPWGLKESDMTEQQIRFVMSKKCILVWKHGKIQKCFKEQI